VEVQGRFCEVSPKNIRNPPTKYKEKKTLRKLMTIVNEETGKIVNLPRSCIRLFLGCCPFSVHSGRIKTKSIVYAVKKKEKK